MFREISCCRTKSNPSIHSSVILATRNSCANGLPHILKLIFEVPFTSTSSPVAVLSLYLSLSNTWSLFTNWVLMIDLDAPESITKLCSLLSYFPFNFKCLLKSQISSAHIFLKKGMLLLPSQTQVIGEGEIAHMQAKNSGLQQTLSLAWFYVTN